MKKIILVLPEFPYFKNGRVFIDETNFPAHSLEIHVNDKGSEELVIKVHMAYVDIIGKQYDDYR